VQPNTTALNPKTFPGDRVAAVITFGELHHTADQFYNVGNGSQADGVCDIHVLSLHLDQCREMSANLDALYRHTHEMKLRKRPSTYGVIDSEITATWMTQPVREDQLLLFIMITLLETFGL
jgi:hypothetical protein